MQTLKFLLLVLWQLPQALVGGFVVLWLGLRTRFQGVYALRRFKGAWLVPVESVLGVSLWPFIIVWERSAAVNAEHVLDHEWGHCRQSLRLGPLYLVLVGIPSLVMNRLTYAGFLKAEGYYKRFPENQADRLGGVSRG